MGGNWPPRLLIPPVHTDNSTLPPANSAVMHLSPGLHSTIHMGISGMRTVSVGCVCVVGKIRDFDPWNCRREYIPHQVKPTNNQRQLSRNNLFYLFFISLIFSYGILSVFGISLGEYN